MVSEKVKGCIGEPIRCVARGINPWFYRGTRPKALLLLFPGASKMIVFSDWKYSVFSVSGERLRGLDTTTKRLNQVRRAPDQKFRC